MKPITKKSDTFKEVTIAAGIILSAVLAVIFCNVYISHVSHINGMKAAMEKKCFEMYDNIDYYIDLTPSQKKEHPKELQQCVSSDEENSRDLNYLIVIKNLNAGVIPEMWTSTKELFKSKYRFNESLSDWNVSNITNMSAMFMEADSFNQPIGNWDVSNVTDMSYMFKGARSFNQPIGNWNVSNVTNMSAMFDSTVYFNQAIDKWNVSNVRDMSQMFKYSLYYNQPIGQWDVSNVTDMSYMFNDTKSFNQPIGEWNVSNVRDMRNMFSGAISFNQDLSQWCVAQFKKKPEYFDEYTPDWEEKHKPKWGTCPRGENKK